MKETQAKEEFLELGGINCSKCNDYFLTKFETGKHKCPSCGYDNEMFCLKEDSPFIDKMEEIIDKVINPNKTKCPLCNGQLKIINLNDNGCKFACDCGYYFGYDNTDKTGE